MDQYNILSGYYLKFIVIIIEAEMSIIFFVNKKSQSMLKYSFAKNMTFGFVTGIEHPRKDLILLIWHGVKG